MDNFAFGQFFSSREKRKYPEISDLYFSVFFGVIFYTLHFPFEKISHNIGRKLLAHSRGEDFVEKNMSRVDNFGRRVYSLVLHAYFTFYTWVAFRSYEWWFPNCLILGIVFPRRKRYNFTVILYYNINLGFYFYKTAELLVRHFFYGKKKDFVVMFFHHLLSFLLLVYSYLSGHAEWGVLVLFLHNFTDIVGYTLRLANDVKFEKLSLFLLVLTILSWFTCRVLLFQHYVIAAGWVGYNYPHYWYHDEHNFNGAILIVLMCVLYVLQIYWVMEITKVLVNVFRKAGGLNIIQGVRKTDDHLVYKKVSEKNRRNEPVVV